MTTTTRTKTATVPAIKRAPSFCVAFPLELQWAVDLGVGAAEEMLPYLGRLRLHELMRDSAQQLKRALLSGAKLVPEPPDERLIAASVDAYMAGLVGRLQQHLIAGMGLPTDEEAQDAPSVH
ncbi:hypothetical protein [Cupriavidus sp. PET2-C1]